MVVCIIPLHVDQHGQRLDSTSMTPISNFVFTLTHTRHQHHRNTGIASHQGPSNRRQQHHQHQPQHHHHDFTANHQHRRQPPPPPPDRLRRFRPRNLIKKNSEFKPGTVGCLSNRIPHKPLRTSLRSSSSFGLRIPCNRGFNNCHD